MESQFKCQCGKPMSSINQLCEDCGSLGPHIFVGNTETPDIAVERPEPGPRQTARQRDFVLPERHQASQDSAWVEKSAPHEPIETGRPPRPLKEKNEDYRPPMRVRQSNEVLDYALRGNQVEEERAKQKSRRSKPVERDNSTLPDTGYTYSEDEGEKEKPKKPNPDKWASVIFSIILILLLIIAAVYVMNNFDDLTKWLAQPPNSQSFMPFNSPPTANSSQPITNGSAIIVASNQFVCR